MENTNLNELFDFYRTKIPLNKSDSITLTNILVLSPSPDEFWDGWYGPDEWPQ